MQVMLVPKIGCRSHVPKVLGSPLLHHLGWGQMMCAAYEEMAPKEMDKGRN